MLRQLLTFLAVLTGFAATAAPAEAHRAGAETRLEAAFEIVVTADRRQQLSEQVRTPEAVHFASADDSAPGFAAPHEAGVRIGIDRARE